MARAEPLYTRSGLHPTLELLDPLNPLRRRMALWLLPLGTLLTLVAWAASRAVGLDPVDRLFLPLLALGFSLLAIVLWRFPRTSPWVLPLAHALVATYLLVTLAYQLLFAPNPLGLSPAAYWVPFVYFSSFLFFQTRQAVRLALLYLLTLFLLSLLGAFRGHLHTEHLNALAQFFGANLAYVGLLYMLVRVKEGYLEAQLEAYTDPLTGLRNRRYLDLVLERELFRVQRYNRPLSLLVLDLDDFKKVNDTYGHPVGDRVLRALARCLEEHLRQSDRPVRLGGGGVCRPPGGNPPGPGGAPGGAPAPGGGRPEGAPGGGNDRQHWRGRGPPRGLPPFPPQAGRRRPLPSQTPGEKPDRGGLNPPLPTGAANLALARLG